MAGLVPVIHFVVQLYITRLSGKRRRFEEADGKSLGLLAFNHVDSRDKPWDKPGHDGVDRLDYFAASPKILACVIAQDFNGKVG
jgi:hypothetical protein